VHDLHVLRALFRTNAEFVRHPYAKDLFAELTDAWDPPGETRTGHKVVPSLVESLVAASRGPLLSTNSFIRGWAEVSLKNGGSQSKRSFLIGRLMGAADTQKDEIQSVPDLYDFLLTMTRAADRPDDIEFIVALQRDEIVFRPVSVVGDYVQRSDHCNLAVHRSLLTHVGGKFGLFTSDQIEELESLLNDQAAGEKEFQLLFEKHPHFFRFGDYREVYPHPYLCHRDEGTLVPDFILTNRELAKAAVLELKLPKPKLVRRQFNRERFATAVMEARAQLLRYRDWFRTPANRRTLVSRVGFEIYEPRLAVVIGRSSDFVDNVDRQRLAADNPDVEVVTYDDLLKLAKQRRILIE
jgi:hypothetical protein